MSLKKTSSNIRIGFLVASLCMFFFLLISFKNILHSELESKVILSSAQGFEKVHDVLIDVQALESAQRGYVITGKEDFFLNYQNARKAVLNDTVFLNSLLSLKSDDSLENKKLKTLVVKKIFHTDNIVVVRKNIGQDSASKIIAEGNGMALMNEINSIIENKKNIYWSQLRKSGERNFILSKRRIWQLLGVAVFLITVLTVNYFFIKRNFNQQQSFVAKLKENASLIGIISDAIVTTDEMFRITGWNKYAELMYGYTEKEAKGNIMGILLKSESTDDDKNKDFKSEITNQLHQNLSWHGELLHYNKKNEPLHVEISAAAILDKNEKFSGTIVVLRNVTEQKKNQRDLKSLNENLESQVKEKVDELRTVFERITDGFISLDKELNFTFANDKACEMYGKPREKVVGRNMLQVTPGIVNEPFYKVLQQAIKNGEYIHAELYSTSTAQWFENWIYPDEVGVSVYYREITVKKKNEEQYRIANERFEFVSKATNEAIWDWDVKTNSVWGNEKYYELLAKENPEISNFEAYTSRIHPEDLKIGLALVEDCLRKKETFLFNEYRYKDKNDKWLTLYNRQYILYDKEGNPFRIIGSLQDVTTQKEIQQQILYEKDLSDAVINSLPGVFYMFNKDRKFIRWNKNIETITGYSFEEMQEKNPVDFVPNEQRELVGGKIYNVFKNGSDFVEADLLCKNNKRIPYYFTGMYINYEGQDCMMGVGIDISEKIKTQEDLRKLAIHLQNIREEERTRIAREIHDELGQQLTGLKMNLSWLSKKIEPQSKEMNQKFEESVQLVDETVKSVRRIATQLRPSILDDLGLISAIEWQTEDFEKRFNIKTAFSSNVNSIELESNVATAIFRVYQESLTNILRHSKATSIKTKIFQENEGLTLSIEDNGIGFDINETKNKKTLGLLGMKERTLMIGGHYQIISEPGSGTTVLISVPVMKSNII